jgi:hypothetical protein
MKYLRIIKPEYSLPCSQKPATGPYPEPDEFSPHPPISTLNLSIATLKGCFIVLTSLHYILTQKSITKQKKKLKLSLCLILLIIRICTLLQV